MVGDKYVARCAFRTLSYSMGGFGAFQLGGFAPDVFDVVISVAGYGLGTLEPEGRLVSNDEPKGCWMLGD